MNTSRKCYQCGSELIVVSSVTEQKSGSLFPQTTTIYRCSNAECQEESDKQTRKRLEKKEEKEKADKRRLEARSGKRNDVISVK